VLVLEENRYY